MINCDRKRTSLVSPNVFNLQKKKSSNFTFYFINYLQYQQFRSQVHTNDNLHAYFCLFLRSIPFTRIIQVIQ